MAQAGNHNCNACCKRQMSRSEYSSRGWGAIAGASGIAALIVFGAALIPATANAAAGTDAGQQAGRLDPEKSFKTSQSVIGKPVGNHMLTAVNGETFSINAYRGKPLIVNLVYSSCSSFCPVTTQHLLSAVEQANQVIGADRFSVLTVGFDARNDTPARMALFAATQHLNLPNWRVASATSAVLEPLLRELGFSYGELAGGFDHIAQTTIIGSDGKVFYHVYGDEFPVQMLMEPLKEAVYGTGTSWSLGGILDHIKFICTHYDPNEKRYRFDIGSVTGPLLGLLPIILVGIWLVRELRRPDRPRRV